MLAKHGARALQVVHRPHPVCLASLQPHAGACTALTLRSKARARRVQAGLTIFGLCSVLDGASRGFSMVAAEPAETLPERELSLLHRHFGGDASVHDNAPMPQQARSGGTISALSVQIPALEKLAEYLRSDDVQIFDLGFGSGVMTAMMLAIAGKGAHVVGVDLADKVPVATANLLSEGGCPFTPFAKDSFSLLGGDAFDHLLAWKEEGKLFDVMYAGCSMDPRTDQLQLFLGQLKPAGAAVFNLGNPGRQGMYFVAEGGKSCELLMRVNFMMAESPRTPRLSGPELPLDPNELGAWIRENIFGTHSPEL
eukprot:TRINITY_DN88067_c0_g1_i1.p1 TRINITY_DN88067_c0_g1~~TRINITY_DN88067_c0_g1_i1.p1  ORF type:complete len:361 (+),score=64.15 TRINITY_DN88067_c0_g1_i1:155-1084(+)